MGEYGLNAGQALRGVRSLIQEHRRVTRARRRYGT